LANSSVRYPERITEDIPVRLQDCFILVDFVVLDMDDSKETTLILGRPFLSTADAHIDVGDSEIRLHINGKDEKFDFRPRREPCSMIRIQSELNPQKIIEVEVTSPKEDNLLTFVRKFMRGEQRRIKRKELKNNTPALEIKDPSPAPPKSKKKVWQVKKTSSSSTSSLGMDDWTSS
jgi:hypothetical protein